MTANEQFQKACEEIDIDLLQKAIIEGCDVNYIDNRWDETCFERMVYKWGCSPQRSVKYMINMVALMIDAGLDLNRVARDEMETTNVFWTVAKWGRSLPFLEYMLQRGMNPNCMDGDYSMLDSLRGDIFAEECCGYLDVASYLYKACRLAEAYGALPGIILDKQYDKAEEGYYEAAMRLDADYFLSKNHIDDLIEIEADKLMVFYAKYGYPKEFYFQSEVFQHRMIGALDKIIDIIGISHLHESVLEECVSQQYYLVLEHLLKLGANPNVNCFTPSYSFVKSSALWTLEKDRLYYEPEIAERMQKALHSFCRCN